MKLSSLLLLAAGVSALALTGCSGSADENEAAAKSQAEQAGQKIKQGADQAGKKIVQGADQAKVDAASDLETSKVLSALKGAAGLETKDIKVESDSVSKTVKLTGNVPTKAQKQQALTVVKGMAGSKYKVEDEIAVKPD